MKKIELKELGIHAFCDLNKETGEISYYAESKQPGFTGLYFRDKDTFFALYPTEKGPIAYYLGQEYPITKGLKISVVKNGKKRNFSIEEYGISINYTESPYIGFDVWSEEEDVDLFYQIEQRYQTDEFYEGYTTASK